MTLENKVFSPHYFDPRIRSRAKKIAASAFGIPLFAACASLIITNPFQSYTETRGQKRTNATIERFLQDDMVDDKEHEELERMYRKKEERFIHRSGRSSALADARNRYLQWSIEHGLSDSYVEILVKSTWDNEMVNDWMDRYSQHKHLLVDQESIALFENKTKILESGNLAFELESRLKGKDLDERKYLEIAEVSAKTFSSIYHIPVHKVHTWLLEIEEKARGKAEYFGQLDIIGSTISGFARPADPSTLEEVKKRLDSMKDRYGEDRRIHSHKLAVDTISLRDDLDAKILKLGTSIEGSPLDSAGHIVSEIHNIRKQYVASGLSEPNDLPTILSSAQQRHEHYKSLNQKAEKLTDTFRDLLASDQWNYRQGYKAEKEYVAMRDDLRKLMYHRRLDRLAMLVRAENEGALIYGKISGDPHPSAYSGAIAAAKELLASIEHIEPTRTHARISGTIELAERMQSSHEYTTRINTLYDRISQLSRPADKGSLTSIKEETEKIRDQYGEKEAVRDIFEQIEIIATRDHIADEIRDLGSLFEGKHGKELEIIIRDAHTVLDRYRNKRFTDSPEIQSLLDQAEKNLKDARSKYLSQKPENTNEHVNNAGNQRTSTYHRQQALIEERQSLKKTHDEMETLMNAIFSRQGDRAVKYKQFIDQAARAKSLNSREDDEISRLVKSIFHLEKEVEGTVKKYSLKELESRITMNRTIGVNSSDDWDLAEFTYSLRAKGYRIGLTPKEKEYLDILSYHHLMARGTSSDDKVYFGNGRFTTPPRSTLRSKQTWLTEHEFQQELRKHGAYDFFRNRGHATKNLYLDLDSLIYDHATGLMWTNKDDGPWITYDRAPAYVAELNRKNYLGHSDWRIPTAIELATLLESSARKCEDCVNDPITRSYDAQRYLHPLFVSRIFSYWTSDRYAFFKDSTLYHDERAWRIDFRAGEINYERRSEEHGGIKVVRTHNQ